MAVDFDTVLLDNIYDVLGVAAVLRSTYGADVALTVMNKTEGVVLDGIHGGQHFAAAKPAVCVRVKELNARSVTRESLKDSTLTFNDATWRIASTQPKPGGGASKGELYLILQTP